MDVNWKTTPQVETTKAKKIELWREFFSTFYFFNANKFAQPHRQKHASLPGCKCSLI